jgi:hypothetical protein
MMDSLEADERRLMDRNARKGDGLMAGEVESEKVADDIAVTVQTTCRSTAVAHCER